MKSIKIINQKQRRNQEDQTATKEEVEVDTKEEVEEEVEDADVDVEEEEEVVVLIIEEDNAVMDQAMTTHLRMKVAVMKLLIILKVKNKTVHIVGVVTVLIGDQDDTEDAQDDHLHKVLAMKEKNRIV